MRFIPLVASLVTTMASWNGYRWMILSARSGPEVKPSWETISVDITGDAAAAKVIDDYVGMRFTDYLSLLKIKGRWMIVNKLYYLHE
jgi:hypothetical protein